LKRMLYKFKVFLGAFFWQKSFWQPTLQFLSSYSEFFILAFQVFHDVLVSTFQRTFNSGPLLHNCLQILVRFIKNTSDEVLRYIRC
jgi:hypothetical protein